MIAILPTTYSNALSWKRTIFIFWFKFQSQFYSSIWWFQVMVWYRTGDKPLFESVLIQFTDVYMRHYSSSYSAAKLSTILSAWWRYRMETFSASLALCEGNNKSPVDSPSEKASNVEHWYFLHVAKQTVEQTVELPVIWGATVIK